MSGQAQITLTIQADTIGDSGIEADDLSEWLAETGALTDVSRQKRDHSTMDLGSTLQIIFSSGATLALAQGLANWLRSRRGVSVTIEEEVIEGSNSRIMKTTVSGIDPATSERIVYRNDNVNRC